ncbi:hypothetical protein D7U74_16920 [Stenotrophomonas maltophilia]|uniref:hypothetical protein n=1 Tax=Stenotrophomonas maltophilia TaxID=40324 RepID=UPI0015DF7D8C|nr:hypothetical protein [Stenotrophomonas maltophilia]MBA0223230.1 hypothetical protein [Stenotrophomonas maltophilia]
MRHLTLPYFCIVVVALLLVLLVRAMSVDANSFALGCAIGIVFFAWRGFEDTKRAWPEFKADRQRAAERRRREAQRGRHPVNDDRH